MREAIERLARLGPIPGESDDEAAIEEWEALLLGLSKPVTDAEAEALVKIFPPDSAYGLGFTLLHLVESAPSWSPLIAERIDEGEWRDTAMKRLGKTGRK